MGQNKRLTHKTYNNPVEVEKIQYSEEKGAKTIYFNIYTKINEHRGGRGCKSLRGITPRPRPQLYARAGKIGEMKRGRKVAKTPQVYNYGGF